MDVSNNLILTILFCSGNQLTELDVSNNTALTDLFCYGNQLTELDVSNNTALTDFICNNNQLIELDISQNTALTYLHCASNQLAELDVSNNPILTSLFCFGNQLTELNVSNSTILATLYCHYNRLICLNLAESVGLGDFNAGDQKIYNISAINGTYDLRQIAPSIDGRKITNITGAAISGTVLSGLQAGTQIHYTYQTGSADGRTIDVTLNVESNQITGILINEENFPDVNFRNYLLSTSYGADGILTEAELQSVTTINVSSKRIADLTGIGYFKHLQVLNCHYNQLTELDISRNTALVRVACSSNKLTALDVSQNTKLTYLNCYGNQLTELDMSNNTKLTGLYCYSNKLTALDVSQNTALTTLSCKLNQLTELDLRNNTRLTTLECDKNRLISLNLVESITLSSFSTGNQKVYTIQATDGQYDLAQLAPSIDASRIINLKGASRSGTVLSGLQAGTQVTYTYQTGSADGKILSVVINVE